MALSKLVIATVSGVGIVAVGIGTTAILTSGSGSVSGAEVAKSSTQKLREKYTAPTHVQLKPFFAPVQGKGGTAPITVFLESYDKNWVGTICRHNPRVRDAILTVLFQYPLRRQGRGYDVNSLAPYLAAPVNQALGRNLVKSAYVVQGAKQMTKGSVSRLPFNASGCKGIKDMKKELQ